MLICTIILLFFVSRANNLLSVVKYGLQFAGPVTGVVNNKLVTALVTGIDDVSYKVGNSIVIYKLNMYHHYSNDRKTLTEITKHHYKMYRITIQNTLDCITY